MLNRERAQIVAEQLSKKAKDYGVQIRTVVVRPRERSTKFEVAVSFRGEVPLHCILNLTQGAHATVGVTIEHELLLRIT